MATTVATVITEMRSRVGDDNSASYFVTDAVWTTLINSANRQLKGYVQKRAEETIVLVSDTFVYSIPSAAQGKDWLSVFVRENSDPDTDTELKNYRVLNDKIYIDTDYGSTYKIHIWFRTIYVIGTDTYTDDALEILYMLCELAYNRHAIHKRIDFEQWASVTRSDASINQLVLSSKEIKEQLKEIAADLSDGPIVYEMSRY